LSGWHADREFDRRQVRGFNTVDQTSHIHKVRTARPRFRDSREIGVDWLKE
jgi:hypothetical protein